MNINIKDSLLNIISKKKFPKYAFIFGMSGIFLIFISGFFGKSIKCSEIKDYKQNFSDEKREKLEKNLESVVSKIKGAGNSKIFLTFESSTETVYATEERKNKEASEDKSSGETTRKKETDDCEKKFITVKDSGGTEHALAVTEIEPKVKGVVVICQGGDDAVVKKRITECLMAALNISSSRICVAKSG